MRHVKFIPTVTAAALLMGLSACALIPERAKWVKVTPVKTAGAADVGRDDRYYQSAVAAINRRDYAAALDLLQAARARTADDVRVLNAFGVVYDKLGRFDLSARYYAQAKALDPGSTIVANNIAYSLSLQAKVAAQAAAAPEPLAIAAASAEPVSGPTQNPSIRLVQGEANILRLEMPVRVAAKPATAGLTGNVLTIINASGRAQGAQPVRTALARLGWSAPTWAMKDGPDESRTTILYAQVNLAAANALARTLNQPVRMVTCAAACAGIRLTLGSDALAWSFGAARAERS